MLRYSKTYILVLQVLGIALIVSAQQTNPNLDATIKDIFNTNPSANSKTGGNQRPGFGTFVTPAPTGTADNLDFQSVSGRAQCNCVEYHLCDPATNTATKTAENDDAVDGFGLIDLRSDFTPTGPSCENILDVCCDGNRTRSESVNVPPLITKPNRPKGCGLRNLGGELKLLDSSFKLNLNFKK